MTIRIEDIKVGDDVTIKVKVVAARGNGAKFVEVVPEGMMVRLLVGAGEIAEHTKKDFGIGDIIVSDVTGVEYEVVGRHGDQLWLWRDAFEEPAAFRNSRFSLVRHGVAK